jgi:putative nucleotidyltransferase with HDIG domain
MRYPDEAEALELLKRYWLFKEIIEHSKKVADTAVRIAEQIRANGHEVDMGLVRSAALLHDIGKWKYNKQKGNEYLHAYETGRLLREMGWPELAAVAEAHVGMTEAQSRKFAFPEPHDTTPKTIEAKIVYLADKIRPGKENLQQIIEFFKNNKDMERRWWSRCPGFLESTIADVTRIWHELEKLGMKN